MTKDNPNRPIGILRASEVRTASSTLKRPKEEKQFTKATHFYAKRIDWSNEPPKVFCVNSEWLNTVFPPDDTTKRIFVVESEEESSLTLEVSGEYVYFSRKDPSLEACQVPRRFPCVLPASRHDDIRAVVGGWQHFNSHLKRRGSEFPEVTMKLHFLQEIDIGRNLSDDEAQQPENFKVDGEDLLRSEPAMLLLPDPDDEEKPLGVTLRNDGAVPLYPYLFYFDPNYLTIS